MNQCNDPDHGAINAERAESRGLRKAWVELDDKRQSLERELAAVTKERDQLKRWTSVNGVIDLQRELDEAREQLAQIQNAIRIELRGHPDSKLWGDSGLIAATMRCVDALDTVTEQRDRLAMACDQYSEDEILCKLQEITEQRDDLQMQLDSSCNAEELRQFRAERDRLAEEVGQLKLRLTQTMGAVTISRNGYVQELEQQRDMLAEALTDIASGIYNEDGCIYKAERTLQSLTPKP